jgi:endonuclease G
MPRPDVDRVKSYLELISRTHGLEKIRATVAPPSGGGLESASVESPIAAAARTGVESVLMNRPPSPDEAAGLEALIIPMLRPAVDIVDGKFDVTHYLWTHLSSKAETRKRIEDVVPSVGRIELPGNRQYPYGGTGFVVGDGLLMTNRHVAAIFANGLGNRNVVLKTGHKAGIDFLHERGRPNGTTLMVRKVVMIHPYWDMAILAVENLPADRKPLKLSLADVSDFDGREIAVIGYPAFDPRNDAAEQDKLFDKEYGVKRLQPGQLHGRAQTESFGKVVSAAAHDCSTLGGNSGSCVMDLETGEIVALHFGGRYQDKNFAVPTFELARDARVVDSGLDFAGRPAGGSPAWADWWSKADLVEATTGAAVSPGPGPQAPQPAPAPTIAAPVDAAGGITIDVPLHITIRLGAPSTVLAGAKPAASESAAIAGGDIVEKLVEPEHDDEYGSRTGYEKRFLGTEIPMPEAADPSVLAKTLDGGTVLHYQNFSVMMNAARRLALVTASNVTADPRLKRPDPTKQYTRRALTGLGDNDQEKWFVDPRLEEKFQLPDIFFTKDRSAFDKGHIVRRDDVTWGKTYEDLRRANGDTYHVTNCSPQVAEFNRSASGHDNWGDLENHVLAGAAEEKLTLFAGPVLDPADTVFVGAGGGKNKIRAKIPSRFWKVIVANGQDGPAAFGFVLEQDLSGVEFEFVVADEFVSHMYPLADIEEMTGVKFPAVVRNADQYDTVRGAEVSMRAGARRKRRRKN